MVTLGFTDTAELLCVLHLVLGRVEGPSPLNVPSEKSGTKDLKPKEERKDLKN